MELRQVLHVIDGRETPSASGRTFQSINPATGRPLAEIAFGESEDVNRAVEAAWRAFDSGVWSEMPPAERGRKMRNVARIIQERCDEIALLESQDNGKPLSAAKADVLGAASLFEYFAQLPEQVAGRVYASDPGYFIYSRREPYGVVGAIAPWNFPFQLACWKTAPALAAGNSVVLKISNSKFGKITAK